MTRCVGDQDGHLGRAWPPIEFERGLHARRDTFGTVSASARVQRLEVLLDVRDRRRERERFRHVRVVLRWVVPVTGIRAVDRAKLGERSRQEEGEEGTERFKKTDRYAIKPIRSDSALVSRPDWIMLSQMSSMFLVADCRDENEWDEGETRAPGSERDRKLTAI